MTREQRLAEGWVECWGLFEYRFEETYWQAFDGTWNESRPKKRMGYRTIRDALTAAAKWNRTVPRRFWRRRRPKAPPPLKVGDEVMVHCRVVALPDARFVRVEEASWPTGTITVDVDSITRGAAK